MQYNYSHDNEGGFILILSAAGDPSSLVGTSGAVVRYNISQNDKSSLISFAGGIAPNTQIYNNTFYIKNGLDTKIIDYSWEMDMTKPFSFQNNIVYNLGSGVIEFLALMAHFQIIYITATIQHQSPKKPIN